MATNEKKGKAPATAVAVAPNTAVATTGDTPDFAADAGAGMEGAGQEAFAIPFLQVLQKGSPTVDEALPTHVEGHKAGMLYENVTGRVFDGKKGVTIVPCSYRREFLRWASKNGGGGGGFKGACTPEQVAELRANGTVVDLDGKLLVKAEDGSVDEKKCDVLKDTRAHYVLIVDEETGAWQEALLSLSSTQIKKSKMLMSALAAVKVKNSAGQMFTPPTFANFVRVTTLGESNDKGTWHGVKFELAGHVNRTELYAAAKAFHANVAKGAVDVKYADPDEHGAPAAPNPEGF